MSQPPDPSERRRVTPWTEERVEQLLTWYFAEKAALPDDALIPSMLQPRPNHGSASLSDKRSGRWLAVLCSVLLVCSGWIVSETLPITAAARSLGVIVLETTSLPMETENSLIVGADGRYAVHNVWRWKSTSYYETATGDLVECSTPELLIDIETLAHSNSEPQP